MAGNRSRLAESLGRLNPFASRGGSPGQSQKPQATQPTSAGPGPTTGPLSGKDGSGPGLDPVQGGQINLVNYSPDEMMQQIAVNLSRVHFGMSASHTFKENTAELWSVLGPIVLFFGTAGEVFFFIWTNMGIGAAWWVALSIIATVAVLECTFMVLSYKCDSLRNQFKRIPGGPTDEDRRDLATHHRFWFVLAGGVAVGQVSFLVYSMAAGLHSVAFLVGFAVGRSVITLAADYYTAFIHRAKPTTGEKYKAEQAERAALTKDALQQKSEEVTIINAGILALQRAHTNAEIEQDSLRTELELKRMENQNRIQTLHQQTEQARMFTELGNNMMRALFDPTLPDAQREKLLATMQGFMAAGRQLPPGYQTVVEEAETGEDL